MSTLHDGLRTVQPPSVRVCLVDTHKSTEQRVAGLQNLCGVWLLAGSSSNFLCRLPYPCDGSEFRGCSGSVFDDVHGIAAFGAFKGGACRFGFVDNLFFWHCL